MIVLIHLADLQGLRASEAPQATIPSTLLITLTGQISLYITQENPLLL